MGQCTQTQHCTVYPFLFRITVTVSIAFFRQGGDPIRADIPLWTGTYFFNFCQSCNLRAFTGTQPSLRGMAHRPSVVRSTFRCLINPTLRQGVSGRYGAFLPGYQAHAEQPAPTLHPQSEPFCASKAFVVHPGKQQPVA